MKIAINGFGRIGRGIFRALKGEVSQINDLADKKTLEHLLKYDSVYGKCDLSLDNIEFTKNLEADIIIEATGKFTDLKSVKNYKAKLVVITAPSKDAPHYIYGVNCGSYKGESVISATSCTTIAAANILNKLKVRRVFLTTYHAYTSTQRLIDSPHKDLARARAAGINLIPTTTGAGEALCKVLPELKGKLIANAVRVPIPIVSLIDLVAEVDEINLKVDNKEPLVSSDFIGDPRAVIIDSIEKQGDLVKILGWYDNEAGYANQVVKLINEIYRS